MSNIEQNLAFILSSRYGEDVRQAIHDAIHDCYEDGKAGSVDLVAREQIANLVANAGSKNKDSEIVDARVDYRGYTHESLGDAFRNLDSESGRNISNIYDILGIRDILLTEFGYFTKEYLYTSNRSAGTSDYIPIEDYRYIIYTGYMTDSGLLATFYDQSKEHISEEKIVGASSGYIKDFLIKIPNDAKYVRISCYFTTLNYNVPIYDCKMYKGIKEEDEKFIQGGYIGSSGEIVSANDGYYTDFISLAPYKNANYIGYLDSNGYNVYFYDSEKNPISTLSRKGTGSTLNRSIDFSHYMVAKFVRFSAWGESFQRNLELIYKPEYNFNSRISRLEESNGKIIRKFENANLLIFGDSITESASITTNSSKETTAYSLIRGLDYWPNLLLDKIKFKEIRNYAKSGAAWTNFKGSVERQQLGDQITIALNDLKNPNGVFSSNDFIPDIIILALGTNNDPNPTDTVKSALEKTVYESDGHTVNIDATISSLSYDTFNESVRKSLLRLIQKFPMAQIYIVIPIPRTAYDLYNNQRDKDLKELASYHSCIIIDGFSNFGIRKDDNMYQGSGTTLRDGLHPNNDGYRLIARGILSALESHYVDLSIFK